MIQPKPETEPQALDQTKQLRSFATKIHADPNERRITATVSTAIVDHDGEVLMPSGMDKSVFNENPLFLLHHDDQSWPLGKWDTSSVLQRKHGIVGEASFIERSPYHPVGLEWLPDTALWYVQSGILKALSVGFIPQVRRPATTKDISDFGKGCQCVTTQWQLLEISLVNIPANQQALIEAVGKGLVPKDKLGLVDFWEIPTRGKKSQIVVDKPIEPSNRLGNKQSGLRRGSLISK